MPGPNLVPQTLLLRARSLDNNRGTAIIKPALLQGHNFGVQTLAAKFAKQDLQADPVESAGHIDDHYESLATLARRLHDFGQTLQPDQWVITGAYEKHPFEVGEFRGYFSGGIGDVRVTLSA